MSKPEWCPDDIWMQAEIEAMKYVEWLIPTPIDADAEHVLAQSFARFALTARQRGRDEGLEEAAKIGDARKPLYEKAGERLAISEVVSSIRGQIGEHGNG